LDIVADLGFDGVTFGFFSHLTRITPAHIRGRGPYWAGVLAERAAARGLSVVDVFGSGSDFSALSLNHPDADERARSSDLFRDLVEIAAGVGSSGVTLLPGTQHEGQERLEALRLSAEELKWRLDHAQSLGLQLSVEPHRGSHVDTPEKVLDLLDLVPGLQLTLDYGHFHVQGIPDSDVDKLLGHARHFHCRGAARDEIQVDFDTNTIDFTRITEAMDQFAYSGWIEIEYICWAPGMGGKECDNLKQSSAFLAFFRGLTATGDQ
jgi:sugar phosphate isomerase/epimerase